MPTIAELGENASLARTIARLNLATAALVGPGDDSAVVAAPDARFTVTTDTMVEGHDFKLDGAKRRRQRIQGEQYGTLGWTLQSGSR